MRKPPKPDKIQFPSLPGRDQVIAAFKRACPSPVGLIAMELEIVGSGSTLELAAFLKAPSVALRHQMRYRGEIRLNDLLDAANILGQTADRSYRLRYRAGISPKQPHQTRVVA